MNKIQSQRSPNSSTRFCSNKGKTTGQEIQRASDTVNGGAAGSVLDDGKISNARMKKKKKSSAVWLKEKKGMGKGDGSGRNGYYGGRFEGFILVRFD